MNFPLKPGTCTGCGEPKDDVNAWVCACRQQKVYWCDDCSFAIDPDVEPLPTCNDDCHDAGFTFVADEDLPPEFQGL